MSKNEWLPVWESRSYPPFLMTIVVDATVFGFKKIFLKSKINRGVCYWQNENGNYLYLDDEISQTVKALFIMAVKKPKEFFKIFETAYFKAVLFNKASKRYTNRSCRNLSDEELIKSIFIYYQLFFDFYSYATVASWFGYNQNNPLYLQAEKILKEKTEFCPDKKVDYFIALTNPPKALKTLLMERDILIFAGLTKRAKIKTVSGIKKNFKNDLENLYNKYKFLSYDFTDSLGWDLNYFAKLVIESQKSNITQEIKNIDNYQIKSASDFKATTKKLGLSQAQIKIFNLIRKLGYYKWLREYEFQEGLYNFQNISIELGRRTGLKSLESKYVIQTEWQKLLRNNKKAKETVKTRMKNCLYDCRFGKKSILLDGLKAKEAYKSIKLVDFSDKILDNKIKGMPAFAGKVIGKVRLVNKVGDAKNFKKGEILVSAATSPDLLFAMKKAGAIITDEGGITCHAAIVARELKIPCIIGTKIATKVLKDGNLVEVDANKGIIKKL